VNLGGAIATGKGNTPLKLEALLQKDRSLRRFSVLSFDGDVPTNLKYIRRQVGQGNIVGLITVHDPDFEFANFSASELADVAATSSSIADQTQATRGRALHHPPHSLQRNGWSWKLAAFERYRRDAAWVARPSVDLETCLLPMSKAPSYVSPTPIRLTRVSEMAHENSARASATREKQN